MQERVGKEQGKGVLRLHNNFVEAIYSLSVDAKKLLLSIILHIQPDNKIQITRKEIMQEIGIDLKNLNPKHREAIIEELMTKIITIRDKDDPNNNWVKMQLVLKTEYKDGLLTTSIYPELFPYFKEAQERLFTRFNIQNIKPLTSIYAIRLYELAKQYDDTGWRELDVNEFRKMLELGDKYYRIFDLKKRVLEPAKRQINERTDISIDYELVKIGRSYKKIKLCISKNKQRVEQKENKKLTDQGRYAELEMKLNTKYRNKTLQGKDGLLWYVKGIKVLNDKEVEVEFTNLEKIEKKIVAIDKLTKMFEQ